LKTERPKQETPKELELRLLGVVRGQFCGDMTDKEWFTHSHFIRKNVVLWPAKFMRTGVIGDQRLHTGFTLTIKRYEEIMRLIFDTIKTHGTNEPIRYWPGYLMKCVQDHWRIHWEDYYKESKNVTRIADAVLVNSGKAASVDRTVEALAMAQGVLDRKRRKSKVAQPKQLSLLDV
jgi:hypothetical protein